MTNSRNATLDYIKQAKRIVIKIGSVLIAERETGNVKNRWIESFVNDLQKLFDQDKEVVIVSSGGVALGRKYIGITNDTPPQSIPLEQKQAASAIGQYYMYAAYQNALGNIERQTAQVLLTLSETENRRMHINARETLNTLLKHNVVPIINENDTVSTSEIRFGDNDRLAVRVGQMIDADLVILLSTIDGLYTNNPHKNPDAIFIPILDQITEEHYTMAGEAVPGFSTGGMKSKIKAADSATAMGISLIITDGQKNGALGDLLDKNQEKRATLFHATTTPKNARKKWIRGHVNPKGTLIIDSGAANALGNGSSLLAIGIKSITGSFQKGDALSIKNENGEDLGVGLSAYNDDDALKIIGKHSDQIIEALGYAGPTALIHRDDLAINTSEKSEA